MPNAPKGQTMPATLRRAAYPVDKPLLETLFAEYLQSLFETAPHHRAALELKYPASKVPALVRGYAAEHLTPKGELLVAELDGTAVAIAMMRELEPGVVEIQRVYVRPSARGHGLGRRLTQALMDKARSDGQHTARLDTGPEFTTAIALYESMGFTRRDAYRSNAAELEEFLIYFERKL